MLPAVCYDVLINAHSAMYYLDWMIFFIIYTGVVLLCMCVCLICLLGLVCKIRLLWL